MDLNIIFKNIQIKQQLKKWPNFFIVGSVKGGTTSLYYYLKQHPEIYMSPIKEPKFFCGPEFQKNSTMEPIVKEKDYLKLFDKVKNEKIVGEASPRYLIDPNSSELIHKKIPDAYILISIRDPVEGAYSLYLMLKGFGILKSSFREEIEKRLKSGEQNNRTILALERLIYYDKIKRYLETFGKNQVKIIIFEEFIKNPNYTLMEILDFLDIDKKDFDFKTKIQNPYQVERNFLTHVISKHIGRKIFIKKYFPDNARKFVANNFVFKKEKKPEMKEEDRRVLKKFYHADVQQMQTLLGRKLPWPNFME